ncbi:auxin-responsive protein IAA32-like [Cynara cardunculus var. scolymus]|uniref:Auxin-responsive protein n=1 Tax=Cynara cardunculus var. scolymus TaxID=59895 RepID=A0A124RKB3_CYNCS|nr:auxin-responsive protein IAA32-like [Cynara cardunculus var. scolymus]KVH01120.1 Aux/IAA-ARF-dimerization [Cynara cardunculus var. scolymus]
MASESSSTYLLNHTDLPSLYYQTNNENGGIIDLGLSLRVLQPETYTHSENPHVADDYHDLLEWNQLHRFENPKVGTRNIDDNVGRNVLRSRKQQSDFVKVNMDGVPIGRKICVLDHSSYLSLAYQLEAMFGRQSLGGLRLFESGSEFSLWYKDQDEQWKIVGDVPWKEFADSVKRIRIILKEETLFRSITTLI